MYCHGLFVHVELKIEIAAVAVAEDSWKAWYSSCWIGTKGNKCRYSSRCCYDRRHLKVRLVCQCETNKIANQVEINNFVLCIAPHRSFSGGFFRLQLLFGWLAGLILTRNNGSELRAPVRVQAPHLANASDCSLIQPNTKVSTVTWYYKRNSLNRNHDDSCSFKTLLWNRMAPDMIVC